MATVRIMKSWGNRKARGYYADPSEKSAPRQRCNVGEGLTTDGTAEEWFSVAAIDDRSFSTSSSTTLFGAGGVGAQRRELSVTSSFASASAADFGIASLSTMRTLENRVRSSVNRRQL